MQTDTLKLKTALDECVLAQKGLSKDAIPVLRCVLISAGYVHATNLAVHVRVPLEYTGDDSFVLPAKGLRDMLKHASGPVTLTQTSPVSAMVTTSATSYSSVSWPVSDFPVVLDPVPGEPVPDWREAYEKIKCAVPTTDPKRYTLRSVAVRDGYMVATDSYRLARYPVDCSDVIVSAEAAQIAAKIKSKLSVSIGDNGSETTIWAGPVAITERHPVQYPNVAKLLPATPREQWARFESEDLYAAVCALLPAWDKVQACVLDIADHTLTLRIGESQTAIPCEHSWASGIHIGANPIYLADMAHNAQGAVDVTFDGALRPMYCTDTAGFEYLLMPIRLAN